MIALQIDLRQIDEAAKRMGVFARDQYPYAMSRTLNDAMFQDVRPRIIGPTWQHAFTVRNTGLARASIRVEQATKQSWQAGVFDALGRANLRAHAEGGLRRADRRGDVEVPNRVRVVLAAGGKRPWAGGVKRAVADPRRAVRVVKGRGVFVGRGGRLEPWYWFRRAVALKKSFAFHEDFARTTRASIARRWPANIERAVATAFR